MSISKVEQIKIDKRIRLYCKAKGYDIYESNSSPWYSIMRGDNEILSWRIDMVGYILLDWRALGRHRAMEIESFDDFLYYINNPLGRL